MCDKKKFQAQLKSKQINERQIVLRNITAWWEPKSRQPLPAFARSLPLFIHSFVYSKSCTTDCLLCAV